MGTTFKDFTAAVMLAMPQKDGKAYLTVRDAINQAQLAISRAMDFECLMVLDTTHAFTIAQQKFYHLVDDLNLARPKDLYTIRYMDDANSRKLTYVTPRMLDKSIPYTEMTGYGRPAWYTRRGNIIELFRIPNDAKPLFIQHSQWPDKMTQDLDEYPYEDIDDVIITLSKDIALATLTQTGGSANWTARARQLLKESIGEETRNSDQMLIAQPFSAEAPISPTGEYWKNPFMKRNP